MTGEIERFDYAALHLGDYNVIGGISHSEAGREAQRTELAEKARMLFLRADLPALVRLADYNFDDTFTLRSMFRDEQRLVVEQVLSRALTETREIYRQVYRRHSPMMRFLTDLNIPQPDLFRIAGELALHGEMLEALKAEEVDVGRLEALLEDVHASKVPLRHEELQFALAHTVTCLMEGLVETPRDADRMRQTQHLLVLVQALELPVDLWEAQNLYYAIGEQELEAREQEASGGDEAAVEWMQLFGRLGQSLRVVMSR